MSPRMLSVFVAMLMGGGSAWADEATGGAPIQLALSDSLSVGFMVPPSWAAQGGLIKAGQSAQLEMVSMNGKHKLKVAVLVPQGKNMPDDMLRKMVEDASSPKLAGSVEDQLNTVEKKTETSYAVYITLTDKELVDKPVPPGQWRYATAGMSNNQGFVTTASLYSQEKDDPGHAHAISAWLAMAGSTQMIHEMSFPAPGDGEPLVFSGPGMHMMEIIHGPPPAGMEFKDGPPPATSVKGQRADGLSFTLETMAVSEAAPTSRECLAPYMANVLGSWAAQPGVIVQKKSIKVEDRGALARLSFTVVGQAKKDTRALDNVAYLLGRPQHCTMVHFMADGGTPAGATLLEQVEKTVSAGK